MKPVILMPSADYLITDFSIDFKYSLNSKEYNRHNLMKNNITDFKLVSEMITFAKNNTNFDSSYDNDYINEYKKEVFFNSLISSLYASSTLTPEIKIDICNNDLFKIVSDMGDNIRRGDISKVHKMMKKFSLKVVEKSNTMFDYFANSYNEHIKIISNFPLEWTNINGLPLMIRHNTSRIFNTPSYMKKNFLLNNSELKVNLESFQKILVISSFKSGDRISNDIRNALDYAIKVNNKDFDKKICLKELMYLTFRQR